MKFSYKKVEFSCDCKEDCQMTNIFLLRYDTESLITTVYYKYHMQEEDSIYQKVMTLSDMGNAALSVALSPENWDNVSDIQEFSRLK